MRLCGNIRQKSRGAAMTNFIDTRNTRYFHLLACIIIAGAGLIVYSNTIHSSFQFDDTTNIVKNELIRDLGNIPAFFHENGVTFPSRGLVTTTFALNYYFSGLSVEGYHWTNVSIHLLNAMLVYFLAIILLDNHFSRTHEGRPFTARVLALFVALLFLTAPVQTHSVTYIFQRNGLMASFFYLSSLILFIKAVTGPGLRRYLYAASILGFLCAIWSKETAYSAPVIMLLYYQCFIASDWRSPGKGLWLVLPYSVLAAVSFYASVPISGGQDAAEWGRWVHLLTQSNALIAYVKLLLLPLPGSLTVDYDLPVAKSLWEFPTLVSSVSVVAILLTAFLYLGRDRAKLPVFSILWFFILLAPTSSFILLRDVMVAHHLYLPCLGFYLLVVVAVHKILCYLGERKVLAPGSVYLVELIILSSFVLFHGICTYEHNRVWQTPITLWEDTVKKSPNKIRPHYNLGSAYQGQGMVIKAWKEYLACRRIYLGTRSIVNLKELESYSMACNNLGVIYSDAGVYDIAIRILKESVKIIPQNTAAHYNLGGAYFRAGRLDAAEAEYKRAIRLRPGHPHAHGGLGAVYELTGRPGKAISAYSAAVEARPDNTDAHMGLGRLMLYYMRDPDRAMHHLQVVQRVCTDRNILERVNKIVDTVKEQALSSENPDTTE